MPRARRSRRSSAGARSVEDLPLDRSATIPYYWKCSTNTQETVMKRFHVHVAVKELQDSIRFYSAMFGAEPSVVKPDYAEWMLDDPRLNFAISQRCMTVGVNHLGFQAVTEAELEGIHDICRQPDG